VSKVSGVKFQGKFMQIILNGLNLKNSRRLLPGNHEQRYILVQEDGVGHSVN